MDRCKSDESSQRRERVRRERVKRERVSRKKIKVREKAEKSRSTLFSQCFVAQEGRKVGSLKQHVRSHLISQMRAQLYAFVALSRSGSQKAKNTSRLEQFWQLTCRKSARDCGAKHVSKSRCETRHVQTTFGSAERGTQKER